MEQRLIDANALLKQPLDKANYPSNYVKIAPTILTIPENPTNGDMIKAMFPNMMVGFITENQIGVYYVKNAHYATVFDLEWWNAPYKKGIGNAGND